LSSSEVTCRMNIGNLKKGELQTEVKREREREINSAGCKKKISSLS
ncbi:hypothetical protein G210_5214, partial [Candida maltosa Xu316]